VLREEAFIAPRARCSLSGGQWYSRYDDVYVDAPGGLDIDHMVPLAEAWDSGAGEWSAKEREAYANDLGDECSLIAVTARSNRSNAGIWQRLAPTVAPATKGSPLPGRVHVVQDGSAFPQGSAPSAARRPASCRARSFRSRREAR
jgi:hypothetical protein